MRESGRHMKVMEKTQNVARGVNNVKKQTNKQSIKLTFFRQAQVGEGNKSCLRSAIISMHRRLSFPTAFSNAGMVISFLNRLINHCAFRMTVLRCFTIKPKS